MTAPHSPRWPRVVAEALAELARPLAMTRTTLRAASWREVIQAWRASAAPQPTSAAVPTYLLPTQGESYRRVRAALAECQGANEVHVCLNGREVGFSVY